MAGFSDGPHQQANLGPAHARPFKVLDGAGDGRGADTGDLFQGAVTLPPRQGTITQRLGQGLERAG